MIVSDNSPKNNPDNSPDITPGGCASSFTIFSSSSVSRLILSQAVYLPKWLARSLAIYNILRSMSSLVSYKDLVDSFYGETARCIYKTGSSLLFWTSLQSIKGSNTVTDIMHSNTAITILIALAGIGSVAAEGINCEGAAGCSFAGSGIAKQLQSYINSGLFFVILLLVLY